MDIAALVKAVISAFDDASALVKRIRDRRDDSEGNALPEEPTKDLLDSLALGPVIVRGHYDHDLKRFGEPYACGDIQAREQMKDVLINLQMALITNLRTVWMDDMEIDFNALQSASDDSRVNAGVCLGQLSQRLSDAQKAQAMYPHNMMPYSTGGMLMPPMSPSLHYSSSRSTASSSTFSRAVPPRTPDSMPDHFQTMSIAGSDRTTIRPQYYERHPSAGSQGSQNAYGRWTAPRQDIPPVPNITQQYATYRQPESDAQSLHSMRRPSSHTLAPEDVVLLSPTTYTPEKSSPQPEQQALPGAEDLDRASYVSYGQDSQHQSSPHLSRTSSAHQSFPASVTSSNRENSNDYGHIPLEVDGRELRYPTVYDTRPLQPESRQSLTSYSSRSQGSNHSTLEHVNYLQQNARAPVPDPLRGQWSTQARFSPPENSQYRPQQPPLQPTPPQPPQQFRQPGFAANIAGRPIPPPGTPPQPAYPNENPQTPRQEYSRPLTSIPIPVDHSRSTEPFPQQPTTKLHSSTSLSQTQSVSPQLPIQPPNRTTSINTQHSQSTTASAGPLILPTDKNLQGFCKGAQRLQGNLEKKAFSIATRPAGMTGTIQFWKCEKCYFEGPLHMTITPGAKKNKPDKSFDPKIRVSSEGIRYRWAFLAKCHVYSKTMPEGLRDGTFGTFQCVFCVAEAKGRGWRNDSSVVFGNVTSFMEHLGMHRRQEMWPCAEMLTRMKCVVGRVAEVGEDFEVCLPPP